MPCLTQALSELMTAENGDSRSLAAPSIKRCGWPVLCAGAEVPELSCPVSTSAACRDAAPDTWCSAKIANESTKTRQQSNDAHFKIEPINPHIGRRAA